jgi:tetratricopeptide (TPR) repeat protein
MGATLFSDEQAARLAAAEVTATKALLLAPNHAFAHYVLGFACIRLDRYEQGIGECERALALDRNLAYGLPVIGLAKIGLGRAEEAEAHVLDGLRLSPRDVGAFQWMGIATLAKLCLGRHEEAVAWARRSIEANRNFPLSHFYLAVAMARLGRAGEARAAAEAGLGLNPSFTIRRFQAGTRVTSPVFGAQLDSVVDGLRMAGVPE